MIKYAESLQPRSRRFKEETAQEAAGTKKKMYFQTLVPILFEEQFLSFSSNKL